MVIQADGKIILAGHSYNYYDDFTIVRYNSDGSLDATFGSSGKVVTNFGTSDDGIFSTVIQSDGKIVVGGMSKVGTTFDFALARYNVNASTGLNDIAEQNTEIKIYPNPFSNSATVEISDPGFSKGQFTIYDLLGREVHLQTLNSKRETLNLDLPKGIYFFKVRNEQNEIVGNGKLMIQ